MKKALWQKREAGVLEKNAAGEGDASEASAAPAEPAVPADSDAVGPKVALLSGYVVGVACLHRENPCGRICMQLAPRTS